MMQNIYMQALGTDPNNSLVFLWICHNAKDVNSAENIELVRL